MSEDTAGRPVPAPEVNGAPGERLATQRAAECRDLLARVDGIDFLAHYRSGDWDFAFVVQPQPQSSETLRDLGAEATHQVRALSDLLRGLRIDTGDVIRLVLQSRDAAIICDQIIPGHCLVLTARAETTRGEPLSRNATVSAADHGLGSTAEILRAKMSTGPVDYGGFLNETRPSPISAAPGIDATLQLLMDESPDLHYVALLDEGKVRKELWGFTKESATQLVEGMGETPVTLLAKYRALIPQAPSIVRRISRLFRDVLRRFPDRIVIDVERGAIYLYQVSRTQQLVALTLVQKEVSNVEDHVAQVALRLEEMLAAEAPAPTEPPAEGGAPSSLSESVADR